MLGWISTVLAILAGLLGFETGGNQAPAPVESKPIEYFCYSNSGSSTYEIYSYEVKKDKESGEMVVVYELNCGNEVYTVPADEELLQALAAIVADHNMQRWDGFSEIDSMILDGSGFSLSVAFEDGSRIRASGSNSFPRGFSAAWEAIDDLFTKYLEKNGIDPEWDSW